MPETHTTQDILLGWKAACDTLEKLIAIEKRLAQSGTPTATETVGVIMDAGKAQGVAPMATPPAPFSLNISLGDKPASADEDRALKNKLVFEPEKYLQDLPPAQDARPPVAHQSNWDRASAVYKETVETDYAAPFAPTDGEFKITGEELQRAIAEADPNGIAQHAPGAKLDAGKPRVWLCVAGFSRALAAVARVTTVGAAKYTPNGWAHVADGEARYMDAFGRHLLALGRGEQVDQDTSCLHKAQMIWNLLASLELELREAEGWERRA